MLLAVLTQDKTRPLRSFVVTGDCASLLAEDRRIRLEPPYPGSAAREDLSVYDESIKLLEMPELNSISVCVYVEQEELFALGERINGRFEEAYMNGYNWDALLRFYVASVDPSLMEEVETDPEAGMFAAYMSYSPENLSKMKRFESHVRSMLADENALMKLITDHYEEIEWD